MIHYLPIHSAANSLPGPGPENRMLNRSLIIFASKLAGYGIRLILPVILVRLMTVADFGAYRQFFLIEMYVVTLFQFGINQALYYFVPRDERNAGAYFINSLTLNTLIFTAAFAGIGLVRQPLSAWLNMAILDSAFWHLAVYTVIWVLISSCDCYLTARKQVKAVAVLEIAGQLIASGMAVAAALHYKDLNRIILAMTIARGVQLLAMLAFIQLRLRGFAAERYLKDLWPQVRYGLVLGIAGTVLTVQFKLHQLFISRYFGTEVFAIYSVGCTEIPIVQMFSQSVAVVALGRFAQMEKLGDWAGIRQLWTRVLTSLYALAIPVVIIFLAISEPLVRIMFTETYIDAVPIFRINTLIKLNLIFNATLVLRAMSRNDVTLWINLVALAVTPFALYGGMMAAGMTGVIGAQFLVLMAARLLMLVWLNRLSGTRLAYIVGPRAIWSFYREVGAKAAGWTASKLRPQTAASDSKADS